MANAWSCVEDHRFEGTWECTDTATWEFQSDGTGYRQGATGHQELKYTFWEGEVIIYLSGNACASMYTYNFTAEDKILYLIRRNYAGSVEVIWLRKKE